MDKVDDWFSMFLSAHMARCPREDWPEEMTEEALEFFGAWRHQFIRKGVTEQFATRASLELAGDPPRFRSEHLPALLKLAGEFRRESAAPESSPESALEDARSASRDCPDCGGNGSAVRFVHADILGRLRTSAGHPIPVGGHVALPCSCPLGRHVARGLAPQGKQPPPAVDQYPSLRRTPAPWGTLADDGLDNKYRYRPDEWDEALDAPARRDGETYDLPALKAIARKASSRPREASSRPREASASRGWADDATRSRDRVSGPISPLAGRPDLADHADDPVIARELARPAPTPTPPEPEPEPTPSFDEEALGWF